MSNNDDPTEKNIHVTHGNDNPYGKKGGTSESGSGWNIGFGGSSGGGFSGGFGGSSRKKAKKRAKARKKAIAEHRAQLEAQARAEAEARAQAQREQAIAAHKQLIENLAQSYQARKAELDRTYATQSRDLSQRLEAEIKSAKKHLNWSGDERWQLYLISKDKSEIEELIARKRNELQALNTQAQSFDGDSPLTRGPADYKYSLNQYSANNPAAAHEAHKKWESSYIAAHEVKMHSELIAALEERVRALTTHHAEQQIKWREFEAIHEGHRRYAEQRQEQIKFKRRVDEDERRELIKASNTYTLPAASAVSGAAVLSRNALWVAEGAAVALETAISSTAKELGRILAIRAGQTISLTATALLYSAELGNGELTPEQRRRLFQGVSVSPDALGLAKDVNLPAIANAGGSVELKSRIKAVPLERGTELNVVSTGSGVPAGVAVINAVLDPLSNTYQAQTSGPSPKQLIFNPSASLSASAPEVGAGALPELFTTDEQTVDIPSGVDTRINDCIVCFPAELGWSPRYFSFENEAVGLGVVSGNGQTVTADWWKDVTQERGAAIPAQIGDRHRNREFKSIEALDQAMWRAIAEDPDLSSPFDEINKKRMARGFAPYAPKATWSGEKREFEFRLGSAANDAAFNLDQLIITRPNSTHGISRITPAFLPWPVSSGNRTWTPLIPPGTESLGSTELPVAPDQTGLYPGETTDPVESQDETLPVVDPTDVNAAIPGYGEDDDLPSPDLVFAGPPVEPLEVGPYNELAGRSRLDGLDIDHISSRQALKRHILKNFPNITKRMVFDHLRRAPSIAIPAEAHRKFSETYGGRNTQEKQHSDAIDLQAAVDSNLNAIKPGLLEAGFDEATIEIARRNLHRLNKEQGWYK